MGEIKNQINSDNFLKYKNIVKDDIIKDFKVSMATDEIARLENIEVEDYQIEEQMESIKQDAENSKEDFDETQIRSRVEATLLRQAVMDFLAEKADLEVKFVDGEGEFDESLMEKLAEESQAREESFEVETTEESEVADESSPVVEASATEEKEVEETAAVVEEEKEETPVAEPVTEDRDLESMSLADKAFYALKDAGALDADGAK